MAGLNLKWVLGLGPLILGLHLVSVALTKALRTYSRSRLEEVCAARGHPGRADDVAHRDEATELASEGLAVLTGLCVAAGLGALAHGVDPGRTGPLIIAIAALVSLAGYLLAGAIGRVYAEVVIDRLWPISALLRAAARPLGLVRRLSEALVEQLARSGGLPRPASVEVEIASDGAGDEDVEADLPDSIRALVQHAVDLTRRDVSELMTPRSAVVMLAASVSAVDAAQAFRETGRSRIPVYGENRDDILGVLYARDLFPRMVDPDGPDLVVPRALVRPAHCVPETKNAYDLFEEFRTERTQIAIVLDEYGGVTGLITLKDLLEELVGGAIDDEHDDPADDEPLRPLGGSNYEVDATLELEQLNERLGLRLPTDGDFLTVGGLAFHALGRVPEPGESFRIGGVEFTVLEVVEHSIRRVRLDLEPRATVSSQ